MQKFLRDLYFAEGKSERIFAVQFSLIIDEYIVSLSHCFFLIMLSKLIAKSANFTTLKIFGISSLSMAVLDFNHHLC